MKKIFTANELRIILFILCAVMLSVIIKAVGLRSMKTVETDFAATDSVNADSVDIMVGKRNTEVSEEKEEIIVTEKHNYSVIININNADCNELCTLPGIGKSTAEKIIKYRQDYGVFGSIEDIMNVNGIGIKKFDKIKDLITTGEVNGKTETE